MLSPLGTYDKSQANKKYKKKEVPIVEHGFQPATVKKYRKAIPFLRNSVDAYRTQELKHFDKSKLSGMGSRESTKQESTKLGSSLMDRNLPLSTYDTGRLSVHIDTPELRTQTRGLR